MKERSQRPSFIARMVCAERTGCIPHAIYVTDLASIMRLTREVEFDVLVNNAGQSSVTVFGPLDVGACHVKNGAGSLYLLRSNGASTSKIAFKGTEDLGGGTSAIFWLEGQVDPDVGTQGRQQRHGHSGLESPYHGRHGGQFR